MTILGIDPGWHFTGYAILCKNERTVVLLDYGYLSMPTSKTLVERSGVFYDYFQEKIQVHGVTDLALETPFLGKNAQNFLKLGYLRGLLYLLSSKNNLVLHEFAPRQVKQAVTGFGGASKEQVSRVVMQLFANAIKAKKYDVTDALAVTLCGLWQAKYPIVLRTR
jgi:crossover junction endodeoxyribonuclease RuvC